MAAKRGRTITTFGQLFPSLSGGFVSAILEFPDNAIYMPFRDKRTVVLFRDRRTYVPFRDKRTVVIVE